MSPIEPVVSAQEPLPSGYGFLKKGNPFMTGLCRRKTHAAHKTLYVVRNKRKVLGLRAPKWILREVHQEERESRVRRQANVERRDTCMESEFRDAIEQMFPDVPSGEVSKIIKRAMKKKSGRVGRTGKLTLGEKARLAVAAHIRHCHTPYDRILNKSKDRAGARKAVYPQVTELMKEWGWRDVTGGSRRRGHGAAQAARAKQAHRLPIRSAPRRKSTPETVAARNTAADKTGASLEDAIEISDSSEEADSASDQQSWSGDSEADDEDWECILVEDSDD
ncbi:hypothetical protein JDV02_008620 [Purpureocillium takamizusanense]|uniref:DUF2293 domain-containing protein n=1 Tax=Purpureocillium takamizusanense TaxID=2060973 RepID=A0A9Q8VFC7_9HYPO|nr:uncharacterized protein JDV02_008620 [Purpureocillium takamizusanense]UNI22759.1 hypothetical protein JDV02_008620 [Purpureocillium takamizusanense]